jgi:hypothetical protein
MVPCGCSGVFLAVERTGMLQSVPLLLTFSKQLTLIRIQVPAYPSDTGSAVSHPLLLKTTIFGLLEW